MWAANTFTQHQKEFGIGIDDVISHYANSSIDGLTSPQAYAFVDDTGLSHVANGDIEALIQAHVESECPEKESVAGRRDFTRMLMRFAERMSMISQQNGTVTTPEEALWAILTHHVAPAMKVLVCDPLSDRLEVNPEYSFMEASGSWP